MFMLAVAVGSLALFSSSDSTHFTLYFQTELKGRGMFNIFGMFFLGWGGGGGVGACFESMQNVIQETKAKQMFYEHTEYKIYNLIATLFL